MNFHMVARRPSSTVTMLPSGIQTELWRSLSSLPGSRVTCPDLVFTMPIGLNQESGTTKDTSSRPCASIALGDIAQGSTVIDCVPAISAAGRHPNEPLA